MRNGGGLLGAGSAGKILIKNGSNFGTRVAFITCGSAGHAATKIEINGPYESPLQVVSALPRTSSPLVFLPSASP